MPRTSGSRLWWALFKTNELLTNHGYALLCTCYSKLWAYTRAFDVQQHQVANLPSLPSAEMLQPHAGYVAVRRAYPYGGCCTMLVSSKASHFLSTADPLTRSEVCSSCGALLHLDTDMSPPYEVVMWALPGLNRLPIN